MRATARPTWVRVGAGCSTGVILPRSSVRQRPHKMGFRVGVESRVAARLHPPRPLAVLPPRGLRHGWAARHPSRRTWRRCPGRGGAG
jgi:hypothetical protein